MADQNNEGINDQSGNHQFDRHRARRLSEMTDVYLGNQRTAPRATHESRIGTDEAHERLQAARNRARRDRANINPEDVGADH